MEIGLNGQKKDVQLAVEQKTQSFIIKMQKY